MIGRCVAVHSSVMAVINELNNMISIFEDVETALITALRN